MDGRPFQAADARTVLRGQVTEQNCLPPTRGWSDWLYQQQSADLRPLVGVVDVFGYEKEQLDLDIRSDVMV